VKAGFARSLAPSLPRSHVHRQLRRKEGTKEKAAAKDREKS
jgi:hypothetical protein